jgi:hypothetical protein
MVSRILTKTERCSSTLTSRYWIEKNSGILKMVQFQHCWNSLWLQPVRPDSSRLLSVLPDGSRLWPVLPSFNCFSLNKRQLFGTVIWILQIGQRSGSLLHSRTNPRELPSILNLSMCRNKMGKNLFQWWLIDVEIFPDRCWLVNSVFCLKKCNFSGEVWKSGYFMSDRMGFLLWLNEWQDLISVLVGSLTGFNSGFRSINWQDSIVVLIESLTGFNQ